MPKKIALNKELLLEKIDELKDIKTGLTDDIDVPSLVFGAKKPALSQSGAQAELVLVNEEFSKVVEALALLVDMTVTILESMADAVEGTDQALSNKFTQSKRL
jgi:hypothetical protein